MTPIFGLSTHGSVREGDFELLVIGARETAEEDVVLLDHGQVYRLTVINHSNRPHEMILKIDGRELGVYDLPANHTIHIRGTKRGKFRFIRQGSDDIFLDDDPLTETTGWIMALFVPPAQQHGSIADQHHMPCVPQPGFNAFLLADHADISKYNLESSVCLEVLMECRPEPPPSVTLAVEAVSAVDTTSEDEALRVCTEIAVLEGQEEKAVKDYDYETAFALIKEIRHKERDLAGILRDGALEHFRKQLKMELAAEAEYESLSLAVFTCPDCKKDCKVPEGAGPIRIKCPHCSCQFVRKT